MRSIEEIKSYNKLYQQGMDMFLRDIRRLLSQINKNCEKSELDYDLERVSDQTNYKIDELSIEINRYKVYAGLVSINQKEIALIEGMNEAFQSQFEVIPEYMSYDNHCIYADYLFRPSQVN